MKPSNAVIWLSSLITVLALIAAGTGLLWSGGGEPFTFTTLRGQTVQMYGQGLYRYETLFTGAGNRGVDAVILVLGIPLLVYATVLYRRGSPRGGLLLAGVIGYFLYAYASYALNAAYNPLFLVYVVLFSASLFGFVLAFTGIAIQTLQARFLADLPSRGLAAFMFASGLLTLFVWLEPLVTALVEALPPDLLDSYTTMVTYALDLAIIVPGTFLSGVLLLRRQPLGYLVAFPLLFLLVMMLPQIVAMTVSQLAAGISFTPGQIVGPISGFAIFGLIAAWILVAFLRRTPGTAQPYRSSPLPRSG